MAEITIFEDEAFSVGTLTAAIVEFPARRRRIAELGLFHEEGINTLTAQIEYDGTRIGLVPAGPRGGVADPTVQKKRRLLPINTVHLPKRDTLMADEIQGVRAFGSQTELEIMQARVRKIQQSHRNDLDATHEFHRIGALNGVILDADGVTPLLDVYHTFGIGKIVYKMELDKATIIARDKCEDVVDLISDELGESPMEGVRAFCGKGFWRALINHKSVRELYLNTVRAAEALGKTVTQFEHGGIVFERYRGTIKGMPYIPDDEARAFPEGVDDFCLTRFSPADYMETANTDGLPYYSKIEMLRFGKGIEIESQSNPLHVPTRPKAIIHLKMGS